MSEMSAFAWPVFLANRLDDQLDRLLAAPAWLVDSDLVEEALADVAAKRKIIDLYWKEHAEATQDLDHTDVMQEVVETLCSPFRNHPEWPGDKK